MNKLKLEDRYEYMINNIHKLTMNEKKVIAGIILSDEDCEKQLKDSGEDCVVRLNKLNARIIETMYSYMINFLEK